MKVIPIDKILNYLRDADGKPLPDGVAIENVNQVKMNSYTNTSEDSVSLEIYFKGVPEISNRKYYAIENLSIKNFTRLYGSIFYAKNNIKAGLFDDAAAADEVLPETNLISDGSDNSSEVSPEVIGSTDECSECHKLNGEHTQFCITGKKQ